MKRHSDDPIAETRELRSRQAGRPISEEEACEIIDNTVGFFEVLIDWHMADKKSADRSAEETSSSTAGFP